MSLLKKNILVTSLVLSFPLTSQAALTLYTTNWSMYGDNRYEYDRAYKNYEPYGKLTYVDNPQMIAQFNKADVVAWSFFQVWNSKDPNQAKYGVKADWDGTMHFGDLWAELPLEGSWIKDLPPETKEFLDLCKTNVASCAAVQLNGTTKKMELFKYTDQNGVGQLNSFGAFINSPKIKAKRIIAIGGANTPENKSVSTYTFDAIFANQENQTKFLNQFKAWMDHFKNLKGVDYDFEPPIDQSGGQLPPDSKTLDDYKNLFNLVKATRDKLGKDAYISVTITVNKEYLAAINQSVTGGWFKSIAPYVNSVNLMTYDMHGPWSKSGDPLTAVHAYLQQPDTIHKDEFAINYGTDEITDQVLSYGMPKDKLQVGIAAYGRGFSGVKSGDDAKLPGFEQPWEGASKFDKIYSAQEGMVPYKSIDRIASELNYKPYAVKNDNRTWVVGSYIYNPEAKQFVGYQSPAAIKSLCEFIKSKQLQGAILWSADTDLPVSNPNSLVSTYKQYCN